MSGGRVRLRVRTAHDHRHIVAARVRMSGDRARQVRLFADPHTRILLMEIQRDVALLLHAGIRGQRPRDIQKPDLVTLVLGERHSRGCRCIQRVHHVIELYPKPVRHGV